MGTNSIRLVHRLPLRLVGALPGIAATFQRGHAGAGMRQDETLNLDKILASPRLHAVQ
jgi:hypothetical protein